jgi:Cu+-exporting ATPase
MVRRGQTELPVPVAALREGDRMVIRNGEIVPADAVLALGSAAIDYSFVTGEARLTHPAPGERVHAGGRQAGGAIELDVLRPASQSHLTEVWNQASSGDSPKVSLTSISTAIGGWFTGVVLALAAVTALVWFPQDAVTAWRAVTGVLIVACPCALALATPFAFGTVARIFGRHGMFLKNAASVETLARVRTAVFDKTGTLTAAGEAIVDFVGDEMDAVERDAVASLARSSHHPLSRRIAAYLDPALTFTVLSFEEVPGEGIAGTVQGRAIRLGSSAFAGAEAEGRASGTRVYCAIDGAVRGFFLIVPRYRTGVGAMAARLARRMDIAVVSGDSDRERMRLADILAAAGEVPVRFNQSPGDKLAVVAELQERGERVLMVGDGLNDAAALRRADFGIAITEDVAAFTPAADAILDARALPRLAAMTELARSSVTIVVLSFAFSLLYNVLALGVAVQGLLSPVLAAVLMPLSSVTVVAASTLTVRFTARRKGLL